jgi:hypothetical protein
VKDLAPVDKAGKPGDCHVEFRDALVDRVAAAPIFRKSSRLRELLVFLCKRSQLEPGAPIHEQEIGVEVFGRPQGYDTSQDTLVRVQVSQLRKKLQQHFSEAGQKEPVVIEIPKGSYTPVFGDRKTASVPADSQRLASLGARTSPLSLGLAVLAVVGLCCSVWLGFRLAGSSRSRLARSEPNTELDRLWLQMFGNRRPVCVVPSDGSIVVFQDVLQRQLSMNEYRQAQFARIAEEEIANPERRSAAKMTVAKPYTHAVDAHLVALIEVLNASHQIHSDYVFTRDFGTSYLGSHNLVLLGTRRSNPWVELFEDRLNFRSRFQESPPVPSFANHAPLPGEEANFAEIWGRHAYCRVAYIPMLTESGGNVLIISGTDMASTQAGGQFISSERWINLLRARLNLSGTARFPYFEVLLKVEYPIVRAPRFEIIAHRVHRP